MQFCQSGLPHCTPHHTTPRTQLQSNLSRGIKWPCILNCSLVWSSIIKSESTYCVGMYKVLILQLIHMRVDVDAGQIQLPAYINVHRWHLTSHCRGLCTVIRYYLFLLSMLFHLHYQGVVWTGWRPPFAYDPGTDIQEPTYDEWDS